MNHNKKTIFFFLPLLTSGGAERVTINILNKLDRTQFNIHLVLGTTQGDGIHLLPKDISIKDLNSPKTMFSIIKLRKYIREVQPDIIFSSLNRAHIALDIALLGLKRRPLVVMRIPSSPKLVLKYNEMGKLFKFFLDRALHNADTIVAQTPEMKYEINKYHNINLDKIQLLINPLDTKEIEQKSKEKLTIFNNNCINVVASGRLRHEKGYDILIKSFKIVYENNNRFRLFIIGADVSNERENYENLVKKLNLTDIVTFLGFQKNPYKFYANSDLFVLSSRREGLPNTVLENLFLQKPIVGTTCIPFMQTLIEDQKNGLLVPVEDVEKLANAILNYHSIDTSYQTIKFNNSSITKIFTKKKLS